MMRYLPKNIVVLDVETTGIDDRKDQIIEVGLVRLERGAKGRYKIAATYASLVNPIIPLDPIITDITNITDAMLESAPTMAEIVTTVQEFVGESPVCAHSAGFDLGFMRAAGVTLGEHGVFDTFELSSLLIRDADSYSLEALVEYAEIPLKNHHRALADAEATARLLMVLLERIAAIPEPELARLHQLPWFTQWSYAPLFPPAPALLRSVSLIPEPAAAEPIPASALPELPPPVPLAVEDFFDVAGPLASGHPGYQRRPAQIEMSQHVAETFAREDILMIEAGTGTGKSLGYLVPAAGLATTTQTPVLIATHSHTLQAQLFDKDIPLLQTAWRAQYGEAGELRSALLIGRRHYLCLQQLARLMLDPAVDDDTMTLIVKILLYLPHVRRGDREEFNLNWTQAKLWHLVASERRLCGGRNCAHEGIPCFYARAWKRAEAAHLVVTNHAHLVTSQSLAGDAFPYLVIDEAHHIEAAMTDQATCEMTEDRFKFWLQGLGRRESGHWTGLLARLRGSLAETELEEIFALIESLFRENKHFWKTLHAVLEQDLELARSNSFSQKRITASDRGRGVWLPIERDAEALYKQLSTLRGRLEKIEIDSSLKDADFKRALIEETLAESAVYEDVLTRGVLHPEDQRWVTEASQNPRTSQVRLAVAPIDISADFRERLLSPKRAIILTSATLCSGGSFDYFRQQTGLREEEAILIPSPFDFSKQVQVYLPDWKGQKAPSAQMLGELLLHMGGRVLVLFTAYTQLRLWHNELAPWLATLGIDVLSQGVSGSRTKILKRYRANPRAVIFGTNSFWEGIDLPGELLKGLVIVKLPFDVPSDPLFAARSERYEDAFYEYSLPRAVLRVRQGFGRLIRTDQDTGVFALLDPRVTQKAYGRVFLDSLPSGMMRVSSLAELDEYRLGVAK